MYAIYTKHKKEYFCLKKNSFCPICRSNLQNIHKCSRCGSMLGGRVFASLIEMQPGSANVLLEKMLFKRDPLIKTGNNGADGNPINSSPFLHYANHFFPREYSNTVRLLCSNVLEGIYWRKQISFADSYPFDQNKIEMLRGYLKQINPDIVVTQEDNAMSSGVLFELLSPNFNICSCEADDGYLLDKHDPKKSINYKLFNNIYWQRVKLIHKMTHVLDGANMNNDRCATVNVFEWNHILFCIMNIHLEVSGTQERNLNAGEIMDIYNTFCKMHPTIIIGDFNDYNANDYYGNTMGGHPTYGELRIAKGSHMQLQCDIFSGLNSIGFHDMFVTFAKLHKPTQYMDYIPTNTTIYGGKTEHAFCNQLFIDNFDFAITPISPFFDATGDTNLNQVGHANNLISDHLPMLLEFFPKLAPVP